ncbi:MAG TPA: S8 family serine peptidase, partial [bacterium]|nr:S8 family serine peptidase [bacterium]
MNFKKIYYIYLLFFLLLIFNSQVNAVTVNDPNYNASRLNILNQLPTAWDYSKGDTNIVVAILSSGIDISHPELDSRITTQGYNAVTNQVGAANAVDDYAPYGHGTLLAGIIMAEANNGVGNAGIMWYGKLMPVKVANSMGTSNQDSVAAGINYAAANGAKIIVIPITFSSTNAALDNAINAAYDSGCVIIANSGNEGISTLRYPACNSKVIAVGAVDNSLARRSTSNYGSYLDLMAPGYNITTTALGDTYTSSAGGTSMSCAYVAGVVGLMLSRNPNLTP